MPRANSSARRAVRSMPRGNRRAIFAASSRRLRKLPRTQQPRQIGAHRPHRRGDRHVVVVQNHNQPRAQRAGVVHRLIGHPRAHRPVADHRDDVPVIRRPARRLQVARHRHAEPGRDRRAAVRRAERVVLALRALGEAGQPAALAQRADPVAPAGQDLVRVALVADVPDQPVVRRVEDGVDRHRQFHHPKAGAQVPPGHRHGAHRLGPQLVGQLAQLLGGEIPQVRRIAHPVQQRGTSRPGATVAID